MHPDLDKSSNFLFLSFFKQAEHTLSIFEQLSHKTDNELYTEALHLMHVFVVTLFKSLIQLLQNI